MRLLWLAGHHFDPPDMGLFRYSKDVASALEQVGVEIQYLGRRRADATDEVEFKNWTQLSRSNRHVRGVVSRLPFMVEEVWDKEYKAALRTALAQRPDAVVIDHLRSAGALEHLPVDLPVIYLSQNHETTVKKSVHESDLGRLRKFAMRFDSAKIARLEQRLCDRASLVSFISSEDRDLFAVKSAVPDHKFVYVPPVYRGARRAERVITPETPRRIVLINNLRWQVKLRNTEELLEVAAPALMKHGVELTMIGSGVDEETQKRHPLVNFLGFVPDLTEALDDARLGVVYEAVGGGLKMKLLDYVFNRVPMAALTGCTAGLPLVQGDYVEVEDPHHFVAQCLAIIDDFDRLNDLHERAILACTGIFDAEVVGARLERAIVDVCTGPTG